MVSPKSKSQLRYLLTLQVLSSTVEGKNLAPVAGTSGTRCKWQALNILSDSILDWAGTGTQESPLKSQTQELTDVVYSVLVDGQLQLFF